MEKKIKNGGTINDLTIQDIYKCIIIYKAQQFASYCYYNKNEYFLTYNNIDFYLNFIFKSFSDCINMFIENNNIYIHYKYSKSFAKLGELIYKLNKEYCNITFHNYGSDVYLLTCIDNPFKTTIIEDLFKHQCYYYKIINSYLSYYNQNSLDSDINIEYTIEDFYKKIGYDIAIYIHIFINHTFTEPTKEDDYRFSQKTREYIKALFYETYKYEIDLLKKEKTKLDIQRELNKHNKIFTDLNEKSLNHQQKYNIYKYKFFEFKKICGKDYYNISFVNSVKINFKNFILSTKRNKLGATHDEKSLKPEHQTDEIIQDKKDSVNMGYLLGNSQNIGRTITSRNIKRFSRKPVNNIKIVENFTFLTINEILLLINKLNSLEILKIIEYINKNGKPSEENMIIPFQIIDKLNLLFDVKQNKSTNIIIKRFIINFLLYTFLKLNVKLFSSKLKPNPRFELINSSSSKSPLEVNSKSYNPTEEKILDLSQYSAIFTGTFNNIQQDFSEIISTKEKTIDSYKDYNSVKDVINVKIFELYNILISKELLLLCINLFRSNGIIITDFSMMLDSLFKRENNTVILLINKLITLYLKDLATGIYNVSHATPEKLETSKSNLLKIYKEMDLFSTHSSIKKILDKSSYKTLTEFQSKPPTENKYLIDIYEHLNLNKSKKLGYIPHEIIKHKNKFLNMTSEQIFNIIMYQTKLFNQLNSKFKSEHGLQFLAQRMQPASKILLNRMQLNQASIPSIKPLLVDIGNVFFKSIRQSKFI